MLKTGLVIFGWLIFAHRGLIVFREQPSVLAPLRSKHQRIVWVSSFFLLLAVSTWAEVYVQFVSAHFEWFLHVPKVLFGITAFVVCLYGCVRYILPNHYLAWGEWVIVAGLLVVTSFTLLVWMGWHIYPERLFEYERLAGLLLKTYLLIGALKIGLSTISWCQLNERGIIIAIRLGLLWWAGIFFAAWMLIDIVVLTIRVGVESSVLATPFVIGFMVAFILALFVSDQFHKRYLVFLYHLNTFVCVRVLELLAYYELASTSIYRSCAVSLQEVLRAPEIVTYKSVISVLDSSKMLCAQPESTFAWALGRRISLAQENGSDYLAVVSHLRGIEMEYLGNIDVLKMLCRLILPYRATIR